MSIDYMGEKMTIEIYSHNTQHYLVDTARFEEELKKEIKYDKYKQNVKVFFINQPRIKGIIETDIDLLLILAIENKDKCFYSIPNYSTEQPNNQTTKQHIIK